MTKYCPLCQSDWPAATSVGAYRNHQRANKIHPNYTCKEIIMDFDVLKEQWQIATAALPWGVQRVFRDVFTLAKDQKTPTPLVWGRDYGDGGACLVNQGAQFLSLIDGEGGHGKPSASFGEVVSLFDRINREFLKADVNIDQTVSPLAADIFLQWFAPLKPQPIEEATSEAVAPEAFANGIIPERSDEDMARALMDFLSSAPAAVETDVNESLSSDSARTSD